MAGDKASYPDTRVDTGGPGRGQTVSARGFTLVDVMVSLAVIAVLIALLMPSLSSVREAARRVVCSSNVRQHGLGLAMYADDYKGLLPTSRFSKGSGRFGGQLQQMMTVRTDDGEWDGLGVLYSAEYLDAAGVFYCPSHSGDHPLDRYLDRWSGTPGAIYANYHFRGDDIAGKGTHGQRPAMIADGMRTKSDYNHRVGCNVLRSDLTVGWFNDSAGRLASLLPDNEGEPDAATKIDSAWDTLDEAPPIETLAPPGQSG